MADDTLSTAAPLLPAARPLPAPFPQLPAGGLHFLSGASGVGKTALVASMAACIHHKRPWCGQLPHPDLPGQAIITVDRGWSENRQWFERAGYPSIPCYSIMDDKSYGKRQLVSKRPEHRISVLRHCLASLEERHPEALAPGTLLYLDPVSYFIGNLLDYDACMVGCALLREVFEELGITVIGLMHASKQSSDTKARYLRLQDRVIGSMAIHGYSDTQMYLASPQECGGDFYTFLWHPHMSPAEEILLTRDDQGLFIPAMSTESSNHTAILALLPATPEGMHFKALLFGLLKSGHEMSRAHLARNLVQLQAVGLAAKVKHGMYRRVLGS